MLEAPTPHLLRVVETTHCKEQKGNGVSIHRAAQAAALRDQADQKKQTVFSFYTLLAAVQTPSAGVLSHSSQRTAVKTILI